MDDIVYFDDQQGGPILGSDGGEHTIELRSREGKLVIRIQRAGNESVDLLFDDARAVLFADLCELIVRDQKIRDRAKLYLNEVVETE